MKAAAPRLAPRRIDEGTRAANWPCAPSPENLDPDMVPDYDSPAFIELSSQPYKQPLENVRAQLPQRILAATHETPLREIGDDKASSCGPLVTRQGLLDPAIFHERSTT